MVCPKCKILPGELAKSNRGTGQLSATGDRLMSMHHKSYWRMRN